MTTKKKRILHIITGLNIGGAERSLFNLLNGGMADHFDCRVISLMDTGTMGPEIEKIGVPVFTIGMSRQLPKLSDFIKLRHLIRQERPDLIQGWMYHGNLAACLAIIGEKDRPILLWNIRHSLSRLNHEKPLTRLIIILNRFLSHTVKAIIYNSYRSRKLHEEFGFSTVRGKTIPNGIDVHKYRYDEKSRIETRRQLGIPDEASVVGHVARLHSMKNHFLFLKTAIALANCYPNTYFILAGRGVSYANKKLARLIPVSVRHNFHLLDERSDINAIMSAMDIFASSSSYGEGFPNVIGEAMATCVPCVATDVGDSAMIIDDTGIIVPPQSATHFLCAIKKLLMMPGIERHSLGARARERIFKNFSLKSSVDKYCETYNHLLSSNRDA